MVETIEIVKDWRCFKAGQTFAFKNPGVNLLVGDQGCGKSSLLMLIQACGHSGKKQHKSIMDVEKLKKHGKLSVSGPCQSFAFDFEKDNFRTKSYFDYDKSFEFHVASMWKSHGESSRALIQTLNQAGTPCVIFIDEPDTALSIKSIFMLERVLKGIAERGGQVIAAVHNPFLILAFDEVLSLEHRSWLTAREFVDRSIREYKESAKDEKKEESNEPELSDTDSDRKQVSGC